jgi:hypothetical protein
MTRPTAAIAAFPDRPPRVRSAITNGTRLPGGIDPNSPRGRRFVDIVADLTQLAGGELDQARRVEVQNIAANQLRLEDLQGAVLRGEDVADEQLVRLSNSVARALTALRRKAPQPRRRGALPHGAPHPLARPEVAE